MKIDMRRLAADLADLARNVEEKLDEIKPFLRDLWSRHDELIEAARPPDLAADLLARPFLASAQAGLAWASAERRAPADSHFGLRFDLGDGYSFAVSPWEGEHKSAGAAHMNICCQAVWSAHRGRGHLWRWTVPECGRLVAELTALGWLLGGSGHWCGENWVSMVLIPRGQRAAFAPVPAGFSGGKETDDAGGMGDGPGPVGGGPDGGVSGEGGSSPARPRKKRGG